MKIEEMAERAADIFERVRSGKPLINHITNFVAMNECANITIAAGARPIMGHALEETVELTAISRALVLNAGNATFCDWNEGMIRSGLMASSKGLPVILDPVGYGAGPVRTRMIDRIINESPIHIIRGNRGEIGLLSGAGGEVSGVDAVGEQPDALVAGKALALKTRTVVAIGGVKDVVTDGNSFFEVGAGHEYMNAITGSGCMATSMIAAWAAVTEDHLMAAIGGLAHYRMAGEKAGEKSSGPGTFLPALMDEIYNLEPEELAGSFPVEEVFYESA
jgi:hydroxyethylthiazole kinase